MVPAVLGALPVTRASSRLIARLIPREETYVADLDSLLGRVATVSLGPITRPSPGKGRVSGPHGNTHFVRIRPAQPDGRFEVGDKVLLTARERSLFDAIAAPASLSGD